MKALVPLTSLLLSGCALFSPYDSTFMCTASDDHGRCIDVDAAYDEALSGHRHTPKTSSRPSATSPRAGGDDAYSAYKDAEYRQLRTLIDAPITPVVRPPKVLRTLITAYAAGDRTLYTPRYVFYIADESRFVIGDDLPEATAASTEALNPLGPSP